MSLKDRLRQAVPIIALGMASITPSLNAQTTSDSEHKPSAITQVAEASWTWDNEKAKTAFDSLPKEYKQFANKSFLERLELKEEWEQRDFLKRDEKRSKILEKNPNAKLKDISPQSTRPNDSLADYPTGNVSFETHILQEQIKGNLTPMQAQIAKEMAILGRPLSTINSNASYESQLRQCGFDVMADLAHGKKEHDLSPREHSIFVAQIQESEMLHQSDKNFEARRDLKIRLEQEYNALYDSHNTLLKRILGQDKDPDLRPTYSIIDEISGKVGTKIEQEEKQKNAFLTKQLQDRKTR